MDPSRQEFRHFPHLPSELRLKIWSYMAPMPCGILSSRNVCYRNEDQPTSKGFFAVIQTCREARNHLLHQESSSVTPAYPHPLPDYRFVRFHPATPKVIYSAERDVLYLTRSALLPLKYRGDVRFIPAFGTVKHLSTKLFSLIRALRLLTLIPDYDIYNDSDERSDEDSELSEDEVGEDGLDDSGNPKETSSLERISLFTASFPALETLTFVTETYPKGTLPEENYFTQMIDGFRNFQIDNNQKIMNGIKEVLEKAAKDNPKWKTPILRVKEDEDLMHNLLL